jgi:cell division protein FtsQ
MSRAPSSRSAGPSNSIKDRISKRTMLLRRLRKWVRPAAWGGFALCVAGLALFTARTVAPGSSIASLRERLGGSTGFTGMRIAHVVIQGRENTPEPLLLAALGVETGSPILGFSVEAARLRIQDLTWVEEATVERRLPDTVVVALKEKRPFAIWQNQNKYVLIDRAGQIVANQDAGRFKDKLPMVVGPGAPAGAAILLTLLDKYPTLAVRIVAAVRVGERRWDLHLKNGIDVMLPEGHEAEALDRLMVLHQDHALLDRPLAAIDMRLPDRLVARPRADAAATTPGNNAEPIPPPPPPPPPEAPSAAKRPT